MAINYATGHDSTYRVLGHKFATNNTRTSMSTSGSSAVTLWTPVGYSKISSTSELLVRSTLVGHSKHCYPFYGVYTQITIGGTSYNNHTGVQYSIGAYISAGSVMLFIDQVWTPSMIGNNTGGMNFNINYRSATNTSCRPFKIWNPNSSDENRAMGQMGSTFYIEEREMLS